MISTSNLEVKEKFLIDIKNSFDSKLKLTENKAFTPEQAVEMFFKDLIEALETGKFLLPENIINNQLLEHGFLQKEMTIDGVVKKAYVSPKSNVLETNITKNSGIIMNKYLLCLQEISQWLQTTEKNALGEQNRIYFDIIRNFNIIVDKHGIDLQSNHMILENGSGN